MIDYERIKEDCAKGTCKLRDDLIRKYSKMIETRKNRIMKILEMKEWGVITLSNRYKKKRQQVYKSLFDKCLLEMLIFRLKEIK